MKHMTFYKSARWKKKRGMVLRRDGYECRDCRRYGKTTAATMVHHVYPLDQHPEYALHMDALISLCNQCHGKMHDRITDELTDKGIEWKNRIKINPPSLL